MPERLTDCEQVTAFPAGVVRKRMPGDVHGKAGRRDSRQLRDCLQVSVNPPVARVDPSPKLDRVPFIAFVEQREDERGKVG